ncbi:MFS transporter [Virgisporangium aliadipatigenens]|uniref:MFS transporter n=1 Tax=Virgisporangium aliadipatigenens TaxID=741659 RepID=A0A8J3YIC6_9ACTN|nr:MFS transporter [Virgisporangium aliadipatigenens]GIJ44555.1 MFS transporter [Virgisporangium aliadipatigenens]
MYVSVRDRPAGDQPDAPTGRRKKVAGTVVLLGIVSLLTDVSSEMVNAVLPLYLTATLGLAVLAYGFIDGIYQGVSALVRIAGGYLGDRNERPKWVAAAGYGISAVSRIAMLPAAGWVAVTGVVTADRLGKGLRTAPRDALIADASDPEVRGRAFGVHRTLDTVGAALGPLVAFALLWAVPGGYDSVWVVSFAFAIVGVAVIVLLVPDRRPAPSGGKPAPRDLLRTMVLLRRPLIACGLLGILTVGDGFMYLSLQHRDDFAARWFPLLYVGSNVAYLVLAVPLGRLADRIGRAKVFLGGHVVLVAVYLTAALPSVGTAWTLVTLLLVGAFYAATDGVLAAFVSRLVPDGARGSGIAAAQTVVAVARFGSSVGFGALWLAMGPSSALLLVAGLLTVVLPVAWWLLRNTEAAA